MKLFQERGEFSQRPLKQVSLVMNHVTVLFQYCQESLEKETFIPAG